MGWRGNGLLLGVFSSNDLKSCRNLKLRIRHPKKSKKMVIFPKTLRRIYIFLYTNFDLNGIYLS